jgi:hypothetical protein
LPPRYFLSTGLGCADGGWVENPRPAGDGFAFHLGASRRKRVPIKFRVNFY